MLTDKKKDWKNHKDDQSTKMRLDASDKKIKDS